MHTQSTPTRHVWWEYIQYCVVGRYIGGHGTVHFFEIVGTLKVLQIWYWNFRWSHTVHVYTVAGGCFLLLISNVFVNYPCNTYCRGVLKSVFGCIEPLLTFAFSYVVVPSSSFKCGTGISAMLTVDLLCNNNLQALNFRFSRCATNHTPQEIKKCGRCAVVVNFNRFIWVLDVQKIKLLTVS